VGAATILFVAPINADIAVIIQEKMSAEELLTQEVQNNLDKIANPRVVTILRNEKLQSNIEGIYPCGEGAGYAGGITSAGADGIRCAVEICKNKEKGC